MKYHYYPGCSLEGTAREYDLSTRSLLAALDVQLTDIEGWTCCGASAAEATSALLALALPARNLALAERRSDSMDVLVPCSACYLNLRTVAEKMRSNAPLAAQINSVLGAEQLHLDGRLRVRHLLDVLATDVGPAAIRTRVVQPLEGAEVFPWKMGGRCCGASHMSTQREVGTVLVAGILEAAHGADAIATVCPMCQMNLEAFQGVAGRAASKDLHINMLYLPQLIGLSMGLDAAGLGVQLNLAFDGALKRRITAAA